MAANPYQFGTRSPETATLQRVLSAHAPPFDTKGTDGIFGKDTRDAVQAAQEFYGIAPADGVVRTPLLVELGIVAPQTSIFDQIGTLVSIINLLKGKTMTADQITGVIRTVLAAGLAYLAGKGLIPVVPPDLVAGLVTVIVGVWSLYSNRPKTIVPIAAK